MRVRGSWLVARGKSGRSALLVVRLRGGAIMQTNWSSAASEPRPRETVSSDKLAHVEKKYRGVAYAPSVTSKKPKRKKKHRKKGREHPDIIAKERAQAEVESEEIGDFYASSASSSLNRQSSSAIGPTAKRKRVGESTYTGSTTDGTASRQILVGSSGGRQYTVSVALPGSIVANAQSRELRTYLMGQIARSLAIFNIDEVIVYDDRSVAAEDVSGKRRPYGDPCHFMARVLQYLETPQVRIKNDLAHRIQTSCVVVPFSFILYKPISHWMMTMKQYKYNGVG